MSLDDDILKGTSNVAEESADTMEQEQHCITVSEAMLLHNESVNVRGVIVGVSELIKMICARTLICNTCDIKLETETYDRPRFVDSPKKVKCPTCNSTAANHYDYVNVVKVKLQDDGSDVQLEQLTCLLFGDDTLNIHPGETVEVKGYVEVEARRDMLHPIVYAQSVKYERKQEPEVTPRDIESFKRFAKMPNLIGRLESMFAPEVIGHAAEKRGILRSLVGSPESNIRGRIHTLLIGPPGVAKSMLTRKAVKVFFLFLVLSHAGPAFH
jgi:DNA replicative helicase MCM subunit Mcm2 (Cdc46/Mcm family)